LLLLLLLLELLPERLDGPGPGDGQWWWGNAQLQDSIWVCCLDPPANEGVSISAPAGAGMKA